MMLGKINQWFPTASKPEYRSNQSAGKQLPACAAAQEPWEHQRQPASLQTSTSLTREAVQRPTDKLELHPRTHTKPSGPMLKHADKSHATISSSTYVPKPRVDRWLDQNELLLRSHTDHYRPYTGGESFSALGVMNQQLQGKELHSGRWQYIGGDHTTGADYTSGGEPFSQGIVEAFQWQLDEIEFREFQICTFITLRYTS